MGILPAQTQALLDAEWAEYRAQHPGVDEAKLRHDFNVIQVMSAEEYDEDTAVWAERRALAKAWLKTQIEDVYSPESVSDEMVQAAVDAYAFESGNPALVTASHILIRNDNFSTKEERFAALESVRKELLASGDLTNEAFAREAQRLTRAGFRTDFNADLTFPEHPMTSFLGEQLSYRAVVEPFAKAAFALSEQNKLSPVTETEFGHHLILFTSRTEEKKADPRADRDFIVSKTIQQGRRMAAEQMISALMNDAEILADEDRVAEIAGAVNQK